MFCRSNLTMNSAQPITLLFLKCTLCCSQDFHISDNSSKTWVPFSPHKITCAERPERGCDSFPFLFLFSNTLASSDFQSIWSHLTLIISWVPRPCRPLPLILTYSSLLNVFLLFLRPLMLRRQWLPCWWPTLAAHFLILSSKLSSKLPTRLITQFGSSPNLSSLWSLAPFHLGMVHHCSWTPSLCSVIVQLIKICMLISLNLPET